MPDHISLEQRQFINQHIESLAQLESLLLLQQASERSWTAQEVAKSLYTGVETCAAILADLQRRGFLSRDMSAEVCYRYQPTSAEIDRQIRELAELYKQRRVAVITLIYSKPSGQVQSLADAFRLRKEK